MNKPILCIIPGWGGTKKTWSQFMQKAKDVFDVRCIELPCFGEIACPNEVWGVGEYAEYVYQELQAIKKESPDKKIILLGHSFGGQVAVTMITHHIDSVNDLVLVAAAVIRPKRILKRFVLGAIAQMVRIALPREEVGSKVGKVKRKLYNLFSSPDYAKTTGVEREIFKKVIREDKSNVLSSITVPTIVFWGRRDRYTPLRQGQKISQMIPTSELIVFPEGKHGLHLTHADDILRVLKSRYTTT
jgi:pimeloyl-ACP methyl ester carboxylesterase